MNCSVSFEAGYTRRLNEINGCIYILFVRTFLYKNMRLKNAQNIRSMLEHTEVEERRRTLILETTHEHGSNLCCAFMNKFALNLFYLLSYFFLVDQSSS